MKTRQIYNYIQSRAHWEEVKFALDKTFFESAFDVGCRTFFGVTLDEDGNLLEDVQFPEFFENYEVKV